MIEVGESDIPATLPVLGDPDDNCRDDRADRRCRQAEAQSESDAPSTSADGQSGVDPGSAIVDESSGPAPRALPHDGWIVPDLDELIAAPGAVQRYLQHAWSEDSPRRSSVENVTDTRQGACYERPAR
jgi:hypothetical protein